MPAKADLHLHSTASDGKMNPKEVVITANNLSLAVIALTDHDTIGGVETARQAAKDLDVEVMSGVEITAAFDDREIHMLAYNFDLNDKNLNIFIKDHQKARVDRAKSIIKNLQKKGLKLTIDEVLAEAQVRNVGRPHIAAVLRDKGYVSSIKEAFIRYLGDKALGGIKNNYHRLEHIIAVVKEAGGVIVVAHPGRLYSEKQLNRFIEAGIDGLETVHPSHSHEIQKRLEHFVKSHGLLMTGGSDFHGSTKKYYHHFGITGISIDHVKMIERLSNHRKKINV